MNQQSRELNEYVKTRIAPSSVHGVGVFALRDIKQGEKLYTDMRPKIYTLPYAEFNELNKEVREYLLERWPQVVNGSAFGFPDTRIQAFMNHSDAPNYDAHTDVALTDIKAGEEIFEDYRVIEGWDKVFAFLQN